VRNYAVIASQREPAHCGPIGQGTCVGKCDRPIHSQLAEVSELLSFRISFQKVSPQQGVGIHAMVAQPIAEELLFPHVLGGRLLRVVQARHHHEANFLSCSINRSGYAPGLSLMLPRLPTIKLSLVRKNKRKVSGSKQAATAVCVNPHW
jgi:hypothetical protein